MGKPAAYLFAILVGAIVWFFFQHFEIAGTGALRVVPKGEEGLNGTGVPSPTDPNSPGDFANSDPAFPNSTTPAQPDSEPKRGFFRSLFPSVANGKKNALGKQPGQSGPVAQGGQVVEGGPTNQGGGLFSSIFKATNLRTQALPRKTADSIRIGSFHLHFFGSPASDLQATMPVVARIIREFDVVALQGIGPNGTTAVSQLAKMAGENFDHIASNPVDTQGQDVQFAFIFNTDTILADRGEGLYTLGDPDGLLRRDPLIGSFMAKGAIAKGASASEAFTFSLINVDTHQSRRLQELNVLDNVMFEVRQDGRAEDDMIMLGCFQASEKQLGQLGAVRGLVTGIRSTPTTVAMNAQTENILFQSPETTDEYLGNSGVINFPPNFQLSPETAREISEYLPIWAEFSIFEGGQRGRMAREEIQNADLR